MGELMTAQQLPDLLRVGIRKVFLNEYESYPEIYSKLFTVENSNRAYEEEVILAGFGLIPEWNSDGGELPTDRILVGDRVVFTHKDYGMMWSVSKRLLREDLYAKVGKELIQEATRALKTTVEVVAHSVLSGGFGGSRPLFSANHQLIGGGTFSNIGTGALSPTTLAEAITRFRRWVNHRGQPIQIQPQTLLVPPELEFTAKTILQSATHPNIVGGSNFSPQSNTHSHYENVLQSAVPQLVVSPFLTDPNDWFLLASPKVHKLRFFWREKPSVETETDFRTKGVLHSITCAFSVGFTDWFGVLGYQNT